MKMMTRAEAINEIKSWDFLEGKEIEAIHTLIPELRESEDEKIVQNLIDKFISIGNENNFGFGPKDFQQEQPEVDLEKVVMIDNIVMNMVGEGYNDGFKTRPFYEEVVRRINARKEESK